MTYASNPTCSMAARYLAQGEAGILEKNDCIMSSSEKLGLRTMPVWDSSLSNLCFHRSHTNLCMPVSSDAVISPVGFFDALDFKRIAPYADARAWGLDAWGPLGTPADPWGLRGPLGTPGTPWEALEPLGPPR